MMEDMEAGNAGGELESAETSGLSFHCSTIPMFVSLMYERSQKY
jgi:hypothetical protein